MDNSDFVLRDVHLGHTMDEQLRQEACSRGVSVHEVFRKHLKAGMRAAKPKKPAASPRKKQAVELALG